MEFLKIVGQLLLFCSWLAVGFGGMSGIVMLCMKMVLDDDDLPAWRWMIFWGVYMSSMFGWIIGYVMFGGWLLHVFGVAP